MKISIKLFLAATSLVASSYYSIAQRLPANLVGDWHATCAIERQGDSAATFCGICPTVFNTDNSSLTVASFNINLGQKELKIIYDGSISKIPFKFDEENLKISFKEKGVVYNFTILELEMLDQLILKSDTGNLLYLERKKEQGR
jgi:hypothetical protein